MNLKFYFLWLLAYLVGVLFLYLVPEESLSTAFRYLFLGAWGAALGALFNVLQNRQMERQRDDDAENLLSRKQPETQFIPIVGGVEQHPENAPELLEQDGTVARNNSMERFVRPEFPDSDWLDFCHELLRNRPFPEIVRRLNDLLPKMFKGASGVLYMYSNNQSELHQIFAFGENVVSDPVIAPAECASFDSAKIVVADYSDPQHVNGCTHLHHRPQGYSFCAPVEGLEEHFGILTLQVDALPDGDSAESWKTKLSAVATAFGLFVANQNLQNRFKTQSLRDQLTGLVNRRYMEEALVRAVSEARRHGTPIGIIMLHPDNLEAMKDEHGSHVAEQMLWELAQRLPRYIRTEDIPCRYADDTLCVLLPGADRVRTEQRAEKIRHEIENLQVAYGKLILRTTLSLGVATYPENAKDAKDLVTKAEQALRQAEALGRNRVCLAQAASNNQ